MRKQQLAGVGAPPREYISDDALPGLAVLLDPASVADTIQSAHRERTWDAVTCFIEYLRYKPQTNCIVLYRLCVRDRLTGATEDRLLYGKCFTPTDYALAFDKACSQRWVPAGRLAAWVAGPDIPALFYVYPNDAQLPGLSLLNEPRKLQRFLYEHPGPFGRSQWRLSDRRLQLETVRYKPERRAVLRIRTRAVHKSTGARENYAAYLRSYVDLRGAGVHRVMEQLHGYMKSGQGPRVPASYGHDPEHRLLLLEALPGQPLAARLLPHLDVAAAEAAGAALARLHRCPVADVPHRTIGSLFGDIQAAGAAISRVLPESRSTVDRILGELERHGATLAAGRAGFVHGDFHQGQVLLHDGQAALLDFDRSYIGDPAADLGNLHAHAHLLELQGRLGDATALTRAFLTGYSNEGAACESGRLDYWTAAGLLQLAVHPFRTFQPGWRASVQSLLERCASCLQ